MGISLIDWRIRVGDKRFIIKSIKVQNAWNFMSFHLLSLLFKTSTICLKICRTLNFYNFRSKTFISVKMKNTQKKNTKHSNTIKSFSIMKHKFIFNQTSLEFQESSISKNCPYIFLKKLNIGPWLTT